MLGRLLLAVALCAAIAQASDVAPVVNVNFANLFSGVNIGGGTGECTAACTGNSVYTLEEVDIDQVVQTMPGMCPNGDRPGFVRWCAKPAGTVDVQIHVRNTGNTIWNKKNVGMALVEEPAYPIDTLTTRQPFHGIVHPDWYGLKLSLTADVAPGAIGVFRGLWSAPAQIGIHELFFQATGPCGAIGTPSEVLVEVTCSDFNFCNGEERFVENVGCVSAHMPACDDGFNCTIDTCNEMHRTCSYEVIPGSGCQTCNKPVCEPVCTNAMSCSDDGCGGSCPCPSGFGCKDGACIDPSLLSGSCQNPLTFFTDAIGYGRYSLTVDTRNGVNQVHPSCNKASSAPEIVYVLDIPATLPVNTTFIGLDARLYDINLVPGVDRADVLDTLLEVREGACLDSEYDEARAVCSDDATPPGSTGSRVATRLLPGKRYYFIVDSYAIQNQGIYTLDIRMTPNYVPSCDAKYCGPDGNGGDCGPCAESEQCSATLSRCLPKNCVPQCSGKQCGPDGCGGQCPNTCSEAANELCMSITGQCQTFPRCNYRRPVCEGGCGADQFCANDCQCHAVTEQFPDFVLSAQTVLDSFVIQQKIFDNASCAVAESCIRGTGMRRVLRMTVEAINQGMGDLSLPPPDDRPDLFIYSPCHGHYHFEGFAAYELLTDNNAVVAKRSIAAIGHKQAYCMEDSRQKLMGPRFNCESVFSCSEPGISAGWSDFYGFDLDCQWVDITGLPAGNYTLRLEINAARGLIETNFENNHVFVPVEIPEPSDAEFSDAGATRTKVPS